MVSLEGLYLNKDKIEEYKKFKYVDDTPPKRIMNI